MDKEEKVFKTEVKWVWVDEDGVRCSPMHDTLGRAIRFKGTWKKPWNGPIEKLSQGNLLAHGTEKPPRTLRKVEITYRFVISADAKVISEAFAKSDAMEESE